MKALEVRINSVMAERRKSQMQTLGAKNEYSNNNGATNVRNSRNSMASSTPLSEVFDAGNGKVNQAYEEEIYGSRTSLPMQARGSVSWKSSSNANSRK